MKKISPKQYAKSLYQATRDLSDKEADKAISSFFEILVKNKSLKSVSKIIKEFENYQREEEGKTKVSVISARKLEKDFLKELESKIKKLFNSKTVEIEETEDKNIIGGVVVKVGDLVWDASVKKQLDNLKIKIC